MLGIIELQRHWGHFTNAHAVQLRKLITCPQNKCSYSNSHSNKQLKQYLMKKSSYYSCSLGNLSNKWPLHMTVPMKEVCPLCMSVPVKEASPLHVSVSVKGALLIHKSVQEKEAWPFCMSVPVKGTWPRCLFSIRAKTAHYWFTMYHRESYCPTLRYHIIKTWACLKPLYPTSRIFSSINYWPR